MFTRIFRLVDRLGRIIVKLSAWASHQLSLSYTQLILRLRTRHSGVSLDTDSTRVEAQVQSLSGLTVILLASVVVLIFWATSSPVIQLFTTNVAVPANNEPPVVVQPTSIPEISQFSATGTILFSMMAGTQEDLFALTSGQTAPIRLTNHPADDRDPVWSPDGQRIAFASRRDGNWELYILELQTGEVRRLTYDPAFEAGPTWSPDGAWLAYEAYYNGNLDIYLVGVNSGEAPLPVTHDPAPDFDPQWTTAPEGRSIAYVSLREGNQEIYILSLDKPNEYEALNLTSTPSINEHEPAWSPDGNRLAYSAVESGVSLIYTKSVSDPSTEPVLIGQGHSPAWSPDASNLVFITERAFEPNGKSLLLMGQVGSWESSAGAIPIPALAFQPDWSTSTLPSVMQGSLAFASTEALPGLFAEPLLAPESDTDAPPYKLIILPGVNADQAYLNDRVDGSFVALRDHVNQAAGWDFLGRLENVYWPINRPLEPGQDPQNWHKAGRAFNIIQAYNQGNPAQIELVPEQIGPDLYWRLYVRAAIQDGTLGEPLRDLPWDLNARYSGDVSAYEAGGAPKSAVPAGYYIDFTRTAQTYGWTRTPSDSLWRSNWPSILYWQYQKTENLDWWSAMLEIYREDELRQALATPVPVPTSNRSASTPEPTSTAGAQQTRPGTFSPTPARTPGTQD